jgi:hypothetical protein
VEWLCRYHIFNSAATVISRTDLTTILRDCYKVTYL